ncbi:tetratricopeptide repeat protein [Enterovirga sp.]|jgi:TPR repeat protein|uniref:tetratricopeptide repeat protein n=1 Tax=Enterovirga sp. TaxID=2026350 RepID=UPI0026032FD5|nr:tetratricopeptide repeat protein [Enterovirga sp.]MDB5590362.1 sel1 repeat family protein [Enterovirga sp.]
MTALRIALALAPLLLAGPDAAGASPATAAARPADLAYGAYQRGLYLTAYREATARLDKSPGDAAAMTLLGELFNQGLAVRANPEEAAAWYRLAAARGSPHAMATLGLMSMDGRGTPRDLSAARSWLDKAAALGEPTAAYNLGLLLLSEGSDQASARAAALLTVAAEAEIADAQHALGVLYSRGQAGLPRDPAKAAALYLRAARNGSIAGDVEFAIVQFNGDGVAKDETAASKHFRRAAARGNAIAQNRLARLYAMGRGVPRSLLEAAVWHLLAKGQGLEDRWLDNALSELPAADRKRAEQLAAERSGKA